MSKGIHNEEDLKKKLRWTHAEPFITKRGTILTLLDEHTSNVIAASVIALSIWAVLLARLAYMYF